jgi:hypothetical protein
MGREHIQWTVPGQDKDDRWSFTATGKSVLNKGWMLYNHALLMSRIISTAAGVLLMGLAAGGCSTWRGAMNGHFQVDLSPMDSMQLLYFPGAAATGTAVPVRLGLTGSGHLEMATGRSPRVLDPFWKQSNNPDWSDLRTDQLVLGWQETRVCFQRLVDAGCYEKTMRPTEDKPNTVRHVKIMAFVGGEKAFLITDKPEFLQLAADLMARF